jgi:hypothetical protein
MMDAHQSDFLTNNLNSDTQFQDFLPQLRKDTFSQVEPIYKWKLDACPRPPAHIGPSPPIQAVHFSPYTGTLPLMSNVAEHDEAASGIDLGSDCK